MNQNIKEILRLVSNVFITLFWTVTMYPPLGSVILLAYFVIGACAIGIGSAFLLTIQLVMFIIIQMVVIEKHRLEMAQKVAEAESTPTL